MVKKAVIAIDGPSGSGKSSITKDVAKKLNLLHVDTGSMFRAIGFLCQRQGIALEESDALKQLLKSLKLVYAKDAQTLIEANGENLTDVIREHSVSALASKVSTIISVRNYLLEFQRGLPVGRTCIMEGRDIGTVVFPDSFCKIYLTASADVRAQRRLLQLQKQGEQNHSISEIKADVIKRDEQDMNRAIAPLKKAEDAILLDTSDLTYQQVVDSIVEIIRKSAKDHNIKI